MFRFFRRPEPPPPTAETLEAVLRRHVLAAWFPRCLDTVHGGFLCDFSRTWRSCGPHDKFLEFQARQTWLAALLLAFDPKNAALQQAVDFGFRCLRDTLWDRQQGGWFHRVSRTGEPLEGHTKHTHGFAYAISACAAVHTATQMPGALELAQAGFAWLDTHAYDRQHGGYFGFLQRDGTPIRELSQNSLGKMADTIGTAVGLKDTNVHSDLLETLANLYRVWPDATVRQRLREVSAVLTQRLTLPSGAITYFCEPDWAVVPHLIRFGYAFQSPNQLLTAHMVLQEDVAGALAAAQRWVDFGLQTAWDRELGGVYFAGPAAAPFHVEGHDLVIRQKVWWVQIEALRALLTLSRMSDQRARYQLYFERLWRFCWHFMLDRSAGGFYSIGLDRLSRVRRRLGGYWAPAMFTRKGRVWKDGFHEGRGLLDCLATLRKPAEPVAQPAVTM